MLALSPKFLPLYIKEFAFVAVVCNVEGKLYAVVEIVITFDASETDVAPEPAIFLNLSWSPSLAENTPTPDAPVFDAPVTAALPSAAKLFCAKKTPVLAS